MTGTAVFLLVLREVRKLRLKEMKQTNERGLALIRVQAYLHGDG